MNVRIAVAALVCALVAGCRGCDDETNRVKPILAVSPTRIDFAEVKVGNGVERTVKLMSQSQGSVSITGVTVRDGTVPGSAAAYEVLEVPEVVPGLNEDTFRLRFKPTQEQSYAATLVVASNDEEHPELTIALEGIGQQPEMSVVPECSMALDCRGTVTVDPPAIDFGEEPLQRQLAIPSTELPKINIINESAVQLVVTRLSIEGPDAAAFKFDQDFTLPAEGLTLEGGEGVNVTLRFKPTSSAQTDYSAEVVIEGDDPNKPQVKVALTGKLGPDLAPTLCANITRVKPGDGSPLISYDTAMDWAPLLTPPMGGYDFTMNRNVQPKSEVTLSALSDSADQTQCTTDREDGRMGLTWAWTLLSVPPDSAMLPIAGAATPTAVLKPIATGEYEVLLTVSDTAGNSTSTTIRFVAVPKEDLVVQLAWDSANVDLDLHLVRPSSGVFSYFDEGDNSQTSGDINGYSWTVWDANNQLGFNFNWGEGPAFDDPRLNLDDTGSGELIENISLNYPENDPACATSECAYRVYVHYFKDARSHSMPQNCAVTSCGDGQPCNCTDPDERCVADSAPTGASPTGNGKCYPAPKPVVRIFLKANPVAAAVIPLDTLTPPDALVIGAPCHMLYVADVIWPAKNAADAGVTPEPRIEVKGADMSGRIVSPQFTRYGIRSGGGNEITCAGNETRGSVSQHAWYTQEPL